VAIYHASTKPIARSAGRSAVAAAAYRAGVELVDARTGLVHDYTRKGGVEHTEILTPDGIGAERNALWDAAELSEKRKDARTAREWIVALPSELNAEQRSALTRDFAQALVERYGVAVDFAIHAPDREGDNRNYHAHILTTTRQVHRGADGNLIFGDKARIELSDSALRAIRDATIAGPWRPGDRYGAVDQVQAVRELWEHTANTALERAGVDARIDARSLQAQGIDREATQHLGPVASEMERRGGKSDRGDGNREVAIHNAERARLSAEIVELQAERQRIRAQERKATARQEFEQSHRKPMPNTLAIWQAVATLVAKEAKQQMAEIQRRWDARRAQRQEREAEAKAQREREAKEKALREAQEKARREAQEKALREAKEKAQREAEEKARREAEARAQREAQEKAQREAEEKAQAQARAREAADRATERETRPGIRNPDKPRWQAERERILADAYDQDVAMKLGRWYRIEREEGRIVLSNAQARITDHGDRITAQDGNAREIETLVALAQAKGWERVTLTGTTEFQARAAQAFVEAGIGLSDARLEQEARHASEAEQMPAPAPERPALQAPPSPAKDERKVISGTPEYWALIRKQVDTFWGERDAIAADIMHHAKERLPDAEKLDKALTDAFYATYKMPDTRPMVRVGFFKSVPDPDWKNPADERDALKKAMDDVGLGRTRDLASSISAARKEADSVLESRDPDRYKKLLDAHFALQKHQREENQQRTNELRRQKGLEIGKKGKGGRGD